LVQPLDIRTIRDRIMQCDVIRDIEHLETLFDGAAKFITITQYKKLNPTAKFPVNPPSHFGLYGGTVIDGVSYVFCRPSELIRHLNNKWDRKPCLTAIFTTVRHESIHVQQVERSGGKISDYDQLPDQSPESMKHYLSNKQEIMAYAQTIIDDLSQFNTYDQILSQLKSTNGIWNSMFANYKNLFKDNPKVLNLLRKYMYLYLTSGQEPMNKPNRVIIPAKR
jgi:hypothetical protein